MRARVTFIHHDCFFLDLGQRRFLFDYPSPEHLPVEASRAAAALIEAADLTVFFSHGHPDHFDPDIAKALARASCTAYAAADDIPEMHPGAIPDGSLIVEPEASYQWRGMGIQTLMSNDLGVAYLIEAGARVYFGGDLADWAWPGMPEAGREATRAFYREAMDRLGGACIDVAFVNCDPRLTNLSGALEFAVRVRPALTVPMHGFGQHGHLPAFAAAVRAEGLGVFCYEKPGDCLAFELDAPGA